jgi:selenocysteine-specific elongation factor
LTLGTAGHVDHGKTALVAALTGVDTDRLPEEKARGLSIVLGYAPLRLPSGRTMSVVDVPGHERFVRTMVAGATGLDCFLMVVAADDGVMPQTREHAEVLRGLGIERGLVAITKADLADPLRAREEARELLPESTIVVCSTQTGAGMEQLTWALDTLALSLPSRASRPGPARLHIDRAFTVAGRGTVVTGTLWSGSVAAGDRLMLLPGRMSVSVRSVQVHDQPVEFALAGQRVAVNLRGVGLDRVSRGDMLAEAGAAGAGAVSECKVLDCRLELRAARHDERVQVHHGTRHVPARLCELGDGLWQVRLERPLLACDGDRLIVRRHAPPETLGGGVVLDAHARRHGRRTHPCAQQPGAAPPRSAPAVREAVEVVPQELVATVERLLADAGPTLCSEAQLVESLAPSVSARQVGAALRVLREQGRAVRVSGRLYGHGPVVSDVRARLRAALERDGAITLSQARDTLGVGRKATQALLEHMDSERVTRRLQDDRRVLA